MKTRFVDTYANVHDNYRLNGHCVTQYYEYLEFVHEGLEKSSFERFVCFVVVVDVVIVVVVVVFDVGAFWWKSNFNFTISVVIWIIVINHFYQFNSMISPSRLPIIQCCPIWHNTACCGNMNLSNCAEFDNLTLNCSVGTKLSIEGNFPFAHLFIKIF